MRVEEPSPKPASEPNHVTLYSYDVFGHLTQVRMDRTIGSTVRTQYRAWTYDPQTLRLLSKTSPEAGTVTYTYNSDNTPATVTDAKNQRKVFTYDNFGRIIQIACGTLSGSTFTEDLAQRTTYAYEGTNNGFSTATNGRVSQITYAGPHGVSFVEMYSYHNAGGVTKKRVQIIGTPFGSSNINMDAAYTYDGEGRVLSIRYPFGKVNSNGTTVDGPLYHYTYDTLGRLQRMSDLANNPIVNDVTYGPADEMLTMTASTFNETRSYNANLQLTELVSGVSVHRKYNYSATQNNGQITSQQDLVSGETISYQYDSLKRLVQASAAGDPSASWAQNFGYDGFGNLTNKTSTNAPQLSVAVDWATNRVQSFAGYDANGNMTGYAGDGYSYDLQNRMIQASVSGAGTVIYGYDTTNHRTYKAGYSSGTYSAEEFYFYGVEGHKYGTWKINPSSGVLLQATVTKQWFGGRLVSPEDRLGSKGKYFAFGEECTNVTPANPPNDQEKFATYTRDAATGLDYANQRYYSSVIGRFTRPDPFEGSARPEAPQSWDRYTYTENDPTNSIDPSGLNLQACGSNWASDASLIGPCNQDDFGGGGGYGGGALPSGDRNYCPAGNGILGTSSIDLCLLPQPPVIPFRPSQSSFECNIQVYKTPAGSGSDPFVHTAVGLQEKIFGQPVPTSYFEAGPKSIFHLGTRDATLTETIIGLAALNRTGGSAFKPYYPNAYELAWESGFNASNCTQDIVIRTTAGRFPNNFFSYSVYGGYLPIEGNSNSFVSGLLVLSGVALPIGPAASLSLAAPGFSHPVFW